MSSTLQITCQASVHDALDQDEWQLEKIQLILERDSSSINKVENFNTPLLRVLIDRRCSAAIIKLLLYFGADPNYVSFPYCTYQTPLFFALIYRYTVRQKDGAEIIRALVEGGAKTDQLDDYILSLAAAMNGEVETIRFLLKGGADLLRPNICSLSQLLCALDHFNVRACRSLINLQGININNLRNKGNGLLLHTALSTVGCTAVFVKFLIDRGIRVDSVDESDNRSLHVAVQWMRQLDLVDVLLKKDSFFSAKNKSEDTSLDLAIKSQCDSDIVHLLLKHFLLENLNLDLNDWVQRNDHRRKILGYANDCKCELRRMNSENVGNEQTLLEFLKIYSKNQMRRNGEHGFNIDYLLQVISKELYPIYSNVISSKFACSLLIDKLEECNVYTVVGNRSDVIKENSLNLNCACVLKNYLDETDLLSLIVAFC